MTRSFRHSVALLVAVIALPGSALASNCRPPCANVAAGLKPSSVIPGPDDARLRGESFDGAITTLNLAGNGSQQVNLGFNFQIGSQTFSSLFVNENGAVSFGAPIGARAVTFAAAAAPSFQPVGNLSELGVPVIAPFYADLLSSPASNRDYIGNIVVQQGSADPYVDEFGRYNPNEFQPALRITWYGLTNNGRVGNGDSVFAQLLLAGDNNGTNSFEFHYGPPGQPGEDADGSIAGFALGADRYQFTGPYRDGVPTYFEFNDGRLAGPLGEAAVPEPATWAELLFGFAMMGLALRWRRRFAPSLSEAARAND